MRDSIQDKTAVVGVGACQFGENWDKSREDMIVEAAYEAYEDAGIDSPQDQIEAVFCGSVYPNGGTGEVAEALKLFGKPISMLSNYCETGTDAFRYGVMSVACGLYDTVLVVGFDKPKDRGVSGPSVNFDKVRGLPSTPAGWFSLCAARYFETFGAGREDLARIAVKNHHNGTLAPKSMLKREITIEALGDDPLPGAGCGRELRRCPLRVLWAGSLPRHAGVLPLPYPGRMGADPPVGQDGEDSGLYVRLLLSRAGAPHRDGDRRGRRLSPADPAH